MSKKKFKIDNLQAYIRPASSSLLSSIGFGLKSMLFGTSRQMKDDEMLRWLHSLKNDPSTPTTSTMNVDLISLTDKHLYFWYLAENDIQVKFVFLLSKKNRKLYSSLYIRWIYKIYLQMKLTKIKFVEFLFYNLEFINDNLEFN